MKSTKRILISFGAITAIVAPVATTISCNSSAITTPFKATTRTNDEIANEILGAATGSLAINYSPSLQNFVDDSGQKVPVTKDALIKYWNKPEGETFRLAAVVNAIGTKIWDFQMFMPTPSDTIIRSIVFGVITDITKKKEVPVGANVDQIKKLASNKLNVYKVALISNIENTLAKFDATTSLQKFDGFINWFINPANKYENLRETLIDGIITDDFIQGMQDELNKPTDTMITNTKQITIINPTV